MKLPDRRAGETLERLLGAGACTQGTPAKFPDQLGKFSLNLREPDSVLLHYPPVNP